MKRICKGPNNNSGEEASHHLHHSHTEETQHNPEEVVNAQAQERREELQRTLLPAFVCANEDVSIHPLHILHIN